MRKSYYEVLSFIVNNEGEENFVELTPVLEKLYGTKKKASSVNAIIINDKIQKLLGDLYEQGFMVWNNYRLSDIVDPATQTVIDPVPPAGKITAKGRDFYNVEETRLLTLRIGESSIAANNSSIETNTLTRENIEVQAKNQRMTLKLAYVTTAFILIQVWVTMDSKTDANLLLLKDEIKEQRMKLDSINKSLQTINQTVISFKADTVGNKKSLPK